MSPSHEALNQSPPLEGYNPFTDDTVLVDAVERAGGSWASGRLESLGRICGGDAVAWGFDANAHVPELKTHDRNGVRIDEVEFHPSWHRLLEMGVGHAVHCLPWVDARPGAHAARAAMMMVLSQAESGVGCPISMTYASVPVLRGEPDMAGEWEPRLVSTDYDPRLVAPATKRSALCGMAMTEKQGGSDLRANTTRAQPLDARTYEITGHKWFCSAPMCDAFLVLAQAGAGPTCFLLPRVLPDGSRNRFFIQRLKDKLGNRSNASSEVEFERALARRVGDEGRGVQTIIEMVNHTRLDCVLGSAAIMRHGVTHATHHCAHRSAFGRLLGDQPLMQNVLADLCVESEAATIVALRLAEAFDRAPHDESERLFRRLATAVCKYHLCKTAVSHAAEALECLGGNGYVEEHSVARYYREAPLNSIWEGAGNVNCLDVLRAMARSAQATEALLAEIESAAGRDGRLDEYVRALRRELSEPSDIEFRARRVVEMMAVALQCSLLLRRGDPVVADAFLGSRLGNGGRAYGTLPAGPDYKAIIERHRPQPGA